MTNLNRMTDANEAPKPTACLVCETMLPDAVDGLLNEAEQRAFDKHVATCMDCATELEEAQRGAAWLGMLKGHAPEPSASLLTKILAQTTGAEATQTAPVLQQVPMANVVSMPAMPMAAETLSVPSSERVGGKLIAFRRKVTDIFSIESAQMRFHPRLAMTAAMAFFSVALTLNMTGVRLTSLRASNLRPSSLRRTVADTGSSAMRSFQNLRVVYQFESKLEDLRQNNQDDERMHSATPYAEPAPEQKQDKGTEQKDGAQGKPQGSSALQFPVVRQDVPQNEGV
jgi:hypothetical protein